MSNHCRKRKATEPSEYEEVTEPNQYAEERAAIMRRNEQIIQNLNLRSLGNEVSSAQPPKKKKKKTGPTTETGEVPVVRNLRSSSRVNATNDDLQSGNEPPEHLATEDTPPQQKKNVRGPTRKADIFARQNKPKLQLEINDRGQPCGPSSTKFANFIGALVRTKGFPLAHDDWKKVCPQAKLKLWADAQLYWEINLSVFDWFTKTAAIKWKEFKSDLKKLYDDDMNDDELMAVRDDRVHEADWKWLIDHWRSPNAALRSLRGKANRSKLVQNHTSGSKSHARVDVELSEELGCPPGRDEVFIKPHTHKSGVPHQGSETTINALKDAIRDHPELRDKSIQEGDAYAYVCGPKRNGYVRVVGLGPSPADLEMPGSRKYTSTKLQMEIEARKQFDKKVEELHSRVDKLQQTLDTLMQMQLSFQNANTTPNGSNNASKVNSRTRPSNVDEEQDDVGSFAGDDADGMLFHDDDDIMNRQVFVRSAMLPRPYGALNTIADARGRSIAWPRDRMKDDKKSLGRPS